MRIGILILLLLASSIGSYAWNARGHIIIAAIAYQEMSNDEQATITGIFKQHPEYAGTWKPDYDDHNDEVELGLYLFMQASVWADQIRNNSRHPQHQYNAPKWHYMNYELRFPYDGSTNIVDPENVLQAIKLNHEKYQSSSSTPEQKAIALCWLIHLVGDIHQPLHSVSLFNEQYPNGDIGGNSFWIKDRGSVNLHSYWDGLLGRSTSIRDILNEAVLLKSTVQLSNQAADLDPKTWSLESFKLARENVYLNGELKGGAVKENAQQVPENYGKQSRQVGGEELYWLGIVWPVFYKSLMAAFDPKGTFDLFPFLPLYFEFTSHTESVFVLSEISYGQ